MRARTTSAYKHLQASWRIPAPTLHTTLLLEIQPKIRKVRELTQRTFRRFMRSMIRSQKYRLISVHCAKCIILSSWGQLIALHCLFWIDGSRLATYKFRCINLSREFGEGRRACHADCGRWWDGDRTCAKGAAGGVCRWAGGSIRFDGCKCSWEYDAKESNSTP